MALEAAALMRQGRVVPLDDALALATAVAHRATLWTQDADFEHVKKDLDLRSCCRAETP